MSFLDLKILIVSYSRAVEDLISDSDTFFVRRDLGVASQGLPLSETKVRVRM